MGGLGFFFWGGGALTDFTPTENQRKALEAVQAAEYDITVTDACQAIGIARQSYYEWFESDAFRAWWQGELDRYYTLRLGRVMRATYEAAISTFPQPRGSTADRKLFLERYDEGYMPKSKHEIAGAVPVDLSQMSQEQLERQAHAAGVKEPQIEGQGDGNPR